MTKKKSQNSSAARLPSRRKAVAELASHLALLYIGSLDEARECPEVEVEYWRIYNALMKSVQSRSNPYLGFVVGIDVLGERRDDPEAAEIAAELWFDKTMRRRLVIARNGKMQSVHRMFLALAELGVAYEEPMLVRSVERPGAAKRPLQARSTFSVFMSRFAEETTESGLRIQKAQGTLWFVTSGASVAVPDGLAVETALCAAPKRIRRPSDASRRRNVIKAVKRAFEAADAPWGKALNLGIYWPDWSEVLTINQMSSLCTFWNRARAIATETARKPWEDEVLEEAWREAAPNGYRSLAEFRSSEVGRAILGRGGVRRTEQFPEADFAWTDGEDDDDVSSPSRSARQAIESAHDVETDDDDLELLTPEEIEAVVRICEESGVQDPVDLYIIAMTLSGVGPNEILQDPDVATRYSGFEALKDHTDKLYDKVSEVLRRRRNRRRKSRDDGRDLEDA